MSENLFGLREFRDAGAFLSGAIIPLVPLPEFGPPAEASVYWCRDHMILSEVGREDALRADATGRNDFDVASLDLSDPDVIRWVDRKIAKALGIRDPAFAALSRIGNRWVMFTLADEREHEIVGTHQGLYDLLHDIPEDDEYLPDVRAALLRHFYGGSNV